MSDKLKKMSVAMAASLTALSLVACGGSPKQGSGSTAASAAPGTSKASETTAAAGQTAGSAAAESTAEATAAKPAEEPTYTIYTTFYPMYDFTKKIVGNTAKVFNIMPPGSSAHDFEPSAKQLAEMSKADVVVYQGAGMEFWIDKAKAALQAENDKILFVEAAEGIELLPSSHQHHHDGEAADEHEHEHEGEHEHEHEGEHEHEHEGEHEHEHEGEHEHEHGAYDPHLWLSPTKAIELLKNIETKLGEYKPEYKDLYEANFTKMKTELEAVKSDYSKKFAEAGLKVFLVTHEAFGYLAKDFGLEQKGLTGMGTEQEPNPEKMAEMIKFAKENKIKIVYYDFDGSRKPAETLAAEIGAEVKPLYSIHSPSSKLLDQGIDYVGLLRQDLDNLLAGAK